MTTEQQEAKRRAEVMLAFANGAPIEWRMPEDVNYPEWDKSTNPCWNWELYDYRVNPNPVVNWDAMPAWANAVAMNEDGSWFWYQEKPDEIGTICHSRPDKSLMGRIPPEYAPKYAGTKPWHELIIERPKK